MISIAGEPLGRNDTYGYALTAQPDKSQGRPTTNTGSQPSEQERPAHTCSPKAPVPDGRTVRPTHQSGEAERARASTAFHTGYQRDRVTELPTAQDHQEPWALPQRSSGSEASMAGYLQYRRQTGPRTRPATRPSSTSPIQGKQSPRRRRHRDRLETRTGCPRP
jgi:hypothetical protein